MELEGISITRFRILIRYGGANIDIDIYSISLISAKTRVITLQALNRVVL